VERLKVSSMKLVDFETAILKGEKDESKK